MPDLDRLIVRLNVSDTLPPPMTDDQVLAWLRREIPNWDSVPEETRASWLAQGIELAREMHRRNLIMYLQTTEPIGSA